MSAGTGIRHSEHNLMPSPLRFIQIWITPRAHGLKPAYGGFDGMTADAQAARQNALSQLVGDRDNKEHRDAPVLIAQDCAMYCAELEPGRHVEFELARGRQAYLLCVEGTTEAGGSGAGFEGETMGRVARQTPGDGRGDFTGDGRGGGKVVGQTWRRFAGFFRGFCATASLASVAQDSSDAVERASSWCVLPVSHDSASLPASSGTGGTGDAARGVDSRDTAL